jgi:hypothetical protein
MESFDGALSFLIGAHFDKCEAAAAAVEFVRDQAHGCNRAGLTEVFLKC